MRARTPAWKGNESAPTAKTLCSGAYFYARALSLTFCRGFATLFPHSLSMADTLQLPAVIQPAQIETGMTIRVHHKIKDIDPEGKEKERVQMFEGLVLKTSGAGNRKTMTIRKVANAVGVEKIFPVFLPSITKIELVKMVKARRNVMSFVRGSKKRFKDVKNIKLNKVA